MEELNARLADRVCRMTFSTKKSDLFLGQANGVRIYLHDEKRLMGLLKSLNTNILRYRNAQGETIAYRREREYEVPNQLFELDWQGHCSEGDLALEVSR